MNLVIDFGNTRVKAALFNGRQLTEAKAYGSTQDLIADGEFYGRAEHAIIGSVTNSHEPVIKALKALKSVVVFMANTPIPLKNAYKTALSLGSDRIAAAVGAYSLYPNTNVLVIDSGTALKFNFTTSNAEYLGGAISPGLQMRFKALKEFTDKLPLVPFDANFNKLIGETTQESILSGVINGFLQEVDGIINEYKKIYPDLTVVVTGGDTDFLANHLKNRIFTHPNLVLTGLNEILIFNSKRNI